MRVLIALLISCTWLATAGCMVFPEDIQTEFAAPTSSEPNHFHACSVCSGLLRAGKPIPSPRPCGTRP